jgi:hypothetical protein
MSGLSGEMTCVQALEKDRIGRAESFLLSPSLSECYLLISRFQSSV